MRTNPQNLKFKKYFKSSIILNYYRSSFKVKFGTFGLQCASRHNLSFSQIEAARKAVRRLVRKSGYIWIRGFPYAPLTKKPLSVRMGKGKGPVNRWVAPIISGQVLLEFKGIASEMMKKTIRAAAKKLPCKARLLKLTY